MPDEPTVDSAEGQLSSLGAGTGATNVVENPGDFCGGEIRIENEAGLVRYGVTGAACFQGCACRGGAAVLPDDGRMDRLAGCAVPHDNGLALVGDADGRHVAGARACLAQSLDGAAQ